MKISVYIAISLDGFIARPDGSLDWLDASRALVPDGEDCGFRAFMDSVDTLVMGRKTFEQVQSLGGWPYGRTPVVVMTRSAPEPPPGLPDTVSYSSETPLALVDRLAGEGICHLYVDGGRTIRGFLADSLVDEITVTCIPVAIGEGIPLFAGTAHDVNLTHMHTTVYGFGFVQTTYRVERSA
jgi:dihydrofolate reductase